MAIYYVAKTGNDGWPGTLAQPRLTIGSGITLLSANDELQVRAGTYLNDQITNPPAGSGGNYTVVRNYPGERPHIQASSLGSCRGVYLTQGATNHHIEIRGFEMSLIWDNKFEDTSFLTHAHHIRLIDNMVHDTVATALLVSSDDAGVNGGDHYIAQNEFYNIGSQWPATHGGAQYTAAMNTIYNMGNRSIVENNVFHDCWGGIAIWTQGITVYDVIIRGNRLYRMLRSDLHSWINGSLQTAAIAVSTMGGRHQIYNNLIYDGGSSAIGTQCNSCPGPDDIQIYHNTVYNCADTGIWNANATNVICRNNVVYLAGGISGTMTSSNNLTTDPSFANAAAGDFHLNASSPAREAGYDVSAVLTTDYDGNARTLPYDLGAFEFGAIPPPSGFLVSDDGFSEDTNECVVVGETVYGHFYLGDDPLTGAMDGGWIFRETGIPPGATVLSCYLTLQQDTSDPALGTPLGDWYVFNIDTPADFDPSHTHRVSDHHGRTGSVAGTITPANPLISPSLLVPVQTVVNRPGFSGDLGFAWRSTGTNGHYFAWQPGTAMLMITWTGGLTNPTLPVVDSFTDANGVLLPTHNANWIAVYNNCEIMTSAARGTTGNVNMCAWNPVSPTEYMEVYGTILAKPGPNNWMSLFLRLTSTDAGTMDGYVAEFTERSGGGNDEVRLYRMTNGAYVQLGSYVTIEFAVGDLFLFRASASDLHVFHNGVQLRDEIDGTYLAPGRIGFDVYGQVGLWDNIGGMAPTSGQFTKIVTGAVLSSASLAKRTSKRPLGALAPLATILKRTARSVSATLASLGVLLHESPFARSLSGTLASASTLAQQLPLKKVLDGMLDVLGQLFPYKTILVSYPVWPPTLPQSHEVEYSEAGAPMIRQKMDAGPDKTRRMFTMGRRQVQIRVLLDRTTVETFRLFYQETLAMGSLPFEWIHPRKQIPVTFQFTADPTYTPAGAQHWMIDLPLEIKPP